MSSKYPGGIITAGADTGYSVAFDGTGDYLTFASGSGVAFGTGNFTIEFWIHPTASFNQVYLMDARNSGQTSSWAIGFNLNNTGNGQFTFFNGVAGAAYNESSASCRLNQWNHCVVARSGTTLSLFTNGTRVATTTNSTDFSVSQTLSYIGRGYSTGSELYYTGYMSNVRIVKGTAIYDPTQLTITPLTQLFPVAGTSLLTCQSPTFIDNSSNALTISVYGDAKVSNFTPFAGYKGFNPALGAGAHGVWSIEEATNYQSSRQWPIYDPHFKNTTLLLHGNGTNGANNNSFIDSSTNNYAITRNGNTTQGTFSPYSPSGYSYRFNGSSDGIYIPSSVMSGSWVNSNFTYEAWLYVEPRSNIWLLGRNNNDTLIIAINNDTRTISYSSFNGIYFSYSYETSPGLWKHNQWFHLAIVRDSSISNTNAIRIFVNGVLVGIGNSGTFGVDNNSFFMNDRIGNYSNMKGYCAGLRITSKALYKENFIPPQRLTAIDKTLLLMCNSSSLVDNGPNRYTLTTITSEGEGNQTLPPVTPFTPFEPAYITPTTYSNWFDGSGDYLTVPSSSAFQFDSGNFTVEMWVYFNSAANAQFLSIPVSGALYFQYYAGALDFGNNVTSLSGSWSPVAGTWYHLAAVRNGSNFTTYVNGAVFATTGSAFNVTATGTLQIGYGGAGTFNGLMSNIRIVKGTAVYTSAFTPPSAPLTNITGTSLLTCQSSTFIDNSSNNFAITAYGNVKPVDSPTPFPAIVDTTTINSSYTPTLRGGSALFDASGDYLSSAGAINWSTYTNLTVEAWIYPNLLSQGTQAIVGTSQGDAYTFIYMYANGSIAVGINGVNEIVSTTGLIKNATWNHIAVVKVGSTTTIYVNGVASGSNTTSVWSNNSRAVWVGSSSNTLFNGYISGLRIVLGSAVYTSNFALPTAPPTPIANTALLLNFTNAGIVDDTSRNVLETVATAQLSSTQAKYGQTSLYFSGESPYSYLKGNANLGRSVAFSTGDFTIECWVYLTTTATDSTIIDTRPGANSGSYFLFYLWNGGYISWYVPGGYKLNTGATVSANTWTHVAVTRSSGTIRSFKDGILQQSASDTTDYANPGAPYPYIGSSYSVTTDSFHGYMDDLRITNGVARYTTNFTPPTSSLQNQ